MKRFFNSKKKIKKVKMFIKILIFKFLDNFRYFLDSHSLELLSANNTVAEVHNGLSPTFLFFLIGVTKSSNGSIDWGLNSIVIRFYFNLSN